MMSAAARRGPAPPKDPVCGMQVDPLDTAVSGRALHHEGATYYFCADECRDRFRQDPARYVRAGKGPDAP
jgi:Cu+-exporting ATPase